MSTGVLVLIELILVFGLVLWFGISQLRALKRDQGDSRADSIGTTSKDDNTDE